MNVRVDRLAISCSSNRPNDPLEVLCVSLADRNSRSQQLLLGLWSSSRQSHSRAPDFANEHSTPAVVTASRCRRSLLSSRGAQLQQVSSCPGQPLPSSCFRSNQLHVPCCPKVHSVQAQTFAEFLQQKKQALRLAGFRQYRYYDVCRMNSRLRTAVEGLPSSTGLSFSCQSSQHSSLEQERERGGVPCKHQLRDSSENHPRVSAIRMPEHHYKLNVKA